MNFFRHMLVAVLTLASVSAFAESFASMDEYKITFSGLRECGGSARIVRSWSHVNLVLEGVRNCGLVSVNGTNHTIPGREGFRNGTYTLSRFGTTRVVVHSHSFKHADSLNVRAFPRASSRTYALHKCGGSLERVVQENGQVSLHFRGVANCSRFDIVSANGAPVDYPERDLRGVSGHYSGSFHLPSRFIEGGLNSVTLTVYSHSRKHQDVITVLFFE